MKKYSVTTFSLQQTAKHTKFPGGEKKFAAWLREQKYLMNNNEPYQKYCNRGWFELALKTIYKANPPFSVNVTRVRIKGLEALEKIVFEQFHKCKPCSE
jgi:phage antirepressor YoqD-like protein